MSSTKEQKEHDAREFCLLEARVVVMGRWRLFRSSRKDAQDIIYIANQMYRYLTNIKDADVVKPIK